MVAQKLGLQVLLLRSAPLLPAEKEDNRKRNEGEEGEAAEGATYYGTDV